MHFDPVVEALFALIDRVGELCAITAGEQPNVVQRLPRPLTAWDRVQDTSVVERHQERVRMLLGGR